MFHATSQAALRRSASRLASSAFRGSPSSAPARLLSSFAVLEQKAGQLNPSSLATIVAAQKLGGPITAFVAGSGAKGVANEVAKIKGVERVLHVESEAYEKVRLPSRGPRLLI